MKSKYYLYKTAYWVSVGQYVKLVKYHARFNFYDVETPAGEKGRAFLHELTSFVL